MWYLSVDGNVSDAKACSASSFLKGSGARSQHSTRETRTDYNSVSCRSEALLESSPQQKPQVFNKLHI